MLRPYGLLSNPWGCSCIRLNKGRDTDESGDFVGRDGHHLIGRPKDGSHFHLLADLLSLIEGEKIRAGHLYLSGAYFIDEAYSHHAQTAFVLVVERDFKYFSLFEPLQDVDACLSCIFLTNQL